MKCEKLSSCAEKASIMCLVVAIMRYANTAIDHGTKIPPVQKSDKVGRARNCKQVVCGDDHYLDVMGSSGSA
jgi:hypothetical protein